MRVLLVGSPASVGAGVLSHDLGLAGRLARRVSALTHRGTDVDVIALEGTPADFFVDTTGPVDIFRYHIVVLSLGRMEARRLAPVAEWTAALTDVIDQCLGASESVRIVVLALPCGRTSSEFPRVLERSIEFRIEAYNDASESIVASRDRVSMVTEYPHFRRNTSSSSFFAAWATLAAPAVAEFARFGETATRPAQRDDEPARQRSLDALAILEEPEARIDRITNSTRDLFGAAGAAVTFIDHDRQWVKSSLGMGDVDTLRIGEFSDVTIDSTDILVVEDASKDPRFRDHPSVTGREHVRFYAGFPIESPDGRRVGALCIVDTRARTFSRGEASLLRGLALQVQSQLWADAPPEQLVSEGLSD